MERSEYEQKLFEVMRQHVGHTALIQGYHEQEITERSIEPANATINYGGFVVHCVTCDISLSQQWNGGDVPRET